MKKVGIDTFTDGNQAVLIDWDLYVTLRGGLQVCNTAVICLANGIQQCPFLGEVGMVEISYGAYDI